MAFGKAFRRLDSVDLLDAAALAQLEAVGITSVEELLSALVADRRSVAGLLGLSGRKADDLERRCRELADPELVRSIGIRAPEGARGVLPPSRSPSRRGRYPRRIRTLHRR
jgi:hypothetical protein